MCVCVVLGRARFSCHNTLLSAQYPVMGGSVKGGQILGEFPTDAFNGKSKYQVGQSVAMIPSTPWEGFWTPIAKWMGVADTKLDEVYPHAKNFKESTTGHTGGLISKSQMFKKN